MIFITLLLAFLLEQIKPVRPNHWAQRKLMRWTNWVEHLFFAGQPTHAYLVWFLSVVTPAILVFFLHTIFSWFTHNLIALAWSVFILYISLGFRQFSAPFTLIKKVIASGDEEQSRLLLAKWMNCPVQNWTQEQVLQGVLNKSVWGLQVHVLGVLTAYAVFAILGLGPTGAILYRLAELFLRRRAKLNSPDADALNEFAQQAWNAINWLPTRVSLILFSVVGSFEDVMTAWRRTTVPERDDKTLLTDAASAAINVRYPITGSAMGHSKHDSSPVEGANSGHYSSGAVISPGHLQSLSALAWRAVIVAMALLLLMQIAQLLAFAKLLLA